MKVANTSTPKPNWLSSSTRTISYLTALLHTIKPVSFFGLKVRKIKTGMMWFSKKLKWKTPQHPNPIDLSSSTRTTSFITTLLNTINPVSFFRVIDTEISTGMIRFSKNRKWKTPKPYWLSLLHGTFLTSSNTLSNLQYSSDFYLDGDIKWR